MPGDPSTPFSSSIVNNTNRLERDEMENVPKIPVIPISYKNAKVLLQSLRGEEVPTGWKGGIKDVVYRIGNDENDGTSIKLNVQVSEEYRPIYNVIATIRGSEEPDRLVILGGHYDAWVYGGVDPHTGVITYMEVARSLGKLLKSGWRPRRTIMIAAWDAEEQGLIGSTEFVETHAVRLSREAVAYINVDSYTGFDVFGAGASPYLASLIRDESKNIDVEYNGKTVTLYEAWKSQQKRDEVRIGYLGSGSDYTAFLQHLGIPSGMFKLLFDICKILTLI
jgi:N-acetylated-alpha-linked acidic dipeptidase